MSSPSHLGSQQLLTDGMAEPHPLLTAGTTPQLVDDDQGGGTHVLREGGREGGREIDED